MQQFNYCYVNELELALAVNVKLLRGEGEVPLPLLLSVAQIGQQCVSCLGEQGEGGHWSPEAGISANTVDAGAKDWRQFGVLGSSRWLVECVRGAR